MKTTQRKPCRHRNTWLIAAGCWEWCYECGAIRGMRHTQPDQVTTVTPRTPWCKPAGAGGDNPWESWDKRTNAYQNRKMTP